MHKKIIDCRLRGRGRLKGKEVSKIHDSYDVEGDKRRLKCASRSHLSLH